MSLFTTISGISNNQTMLDVIGDNIANINTTGFKSSKINFQTVFSNTLSSGAVPVAGSGGVNPKQIGLGVTVSEITRNFTRGAVQSTGRSADLNIQGEGFFSLQDAQNKMVLTRAGNFSVDSEGNLVNPQGLKALGTSFVTSQTGSTTTIKVPPALVLEETNVMTGGGTIINSGDFTINIGGTAKSITISDTDTMQDIVGKINSASNSIPSTNVAALNSANKIVITGPDSVTLANGTSNFASIANIDNNYTSNILGADGDVIPVASEGDFTISTNGGADATITLLNGDTYGTVAAAIEAAIAADGGTSTVSIDATGKIIISGPDTVAFTAGTSALPTAAGFSHGTSTTTVLADNPKINIKAADASSVNNYKVTSYSISNDGSIEASYSNGGRLTVSGDPIKSLKYISSGSQEILGTDVTQSGGIVVDPAQLQMQLAQVINPNGLSSLGGNLFGMNEVAGTPSFAIGRAGGMGIIDSGALETSNVDLPTEFANMILAQKAVEANSRAFSIQNQIMDTIVNLGR